MIPQTPQTTVPDVDVVIVTYNSAADIERCLASLFAHNQRYAYRVTVVDNASSDGTPQLVASRFPAVRLIRCKKNIGFASANNLAAAGVQGKYIVFLNPDTEIREGGLDRLIDFLENHPKVGAAGPKLLNSDGSLQSCGNSFLSLHNLFLEIIFLSRFLQCNRKEATPVGWVVGACLAVRRELGDKLGWFDPQFFMYVEEVDFCRRIWNVGYAVYCVSQAEVIHYGGAGPKAYSGQKVLWWHKSIFYYFRKHHPGKLFALRCLIFFRSLLRSGLWFLLTPIYGRFAWEKTCSYLKTILQPEGGNAV